ncbi:MAG: IS66 family transposase [Bythopirellula sp.]
MTHPTSLSKDELLEFLAQMEQQQTLALATKDAELESQREQLRQQDIAIQTKDLTIEQLTQERDEYKLAFDKLMQQRFRNRSERYIDNPDQLRLDLGDTDEAADAALGLADAVEDLEQTIPEHKRRKRRKKRDESLPEHLPRYDITAEVPAEKKICADHGERTLLPESMWDRTETLEFERPKLRVRVTKYPKFVCDRQPQCGIAAPERPTGIVEGDKYDSSIAAEIITGKYSYHLPLYRLQDYFAGSGWNPSRSTQCNILGNVDFIIQPLLEFFRQTLQTDGAVGCDDTGVTLLYPKTIPHFDLSDPKQRRIHEVFQEALDNNKPSISGKMWAYRGVNIKLNVFDFTVSRHRDGPELFFADYKGTLLGDCWHGFEAIAVASDGRIVRAACNSHARRKFENSTSYPADRAQWMVWYQQLYEIEDRGKQMSREERWALRQLEAKPIWDAMKAWLEEVKQRTTNVILPKSDFAKALQYVRNHFVELKRYLDDGRLPIDNNETEQLMKQVALGRKNWLFAGSVEGGERSAGFLTLVSSALRNDLDVWVYVKDVLDQLLAGTTDYEPLLPWNWAASHPEAIRKYRVEERRERFDRQKAKRADRRHKKKDTI